MTERQIKDLKHIKDRIEFYTGLDVTTDTRERKYVYARMVFCRIIRDRYRMTVKTIGQFLGRSHCTIVYLTKNFKTIEKYEKEFYKVYQYILLEMDSEQIYIGRKPIGEKRDIDKDILKVREAIKDAVESLQIV